VPPVTAELSVDGRRLDRWPEDGVELAAGRHRLEVHAPRHLPWTGEIDVQGRGQRQQVEAALVPDWASVEIATEPAGARVFVDGTDSGQTPVRLELSAGTRAIRVEKDGYKTLSRELLVRAGEPQQLNGLRLEPADGLLRVVTEPAGATVTIAGRYRGVTPLEVELAPGRRHAVQLAKPGYAPLRREVDFTSSRGATLRETLEPQLGTVRLNVIPADAELLVDGTIAAGEASRELMLPSFRHRLEVRKEGYVTWRGEVTPRPGQPQVLEVKLLTPAEATLARTPRLLKTSQGLGLRRVGPGSFRTGAPRREQGRRVNETERDVQLTRAYYLGIREVTNREFREFRPTHTSGVTSYRELSGSDHPAVMLGWEDAAAYCNWLSEREQLPAAYERSGGSYRLASPLTTGYRLPTEAEWEWAARYSGGGGERRYPWGDRFELPAGAGNFADKSARSVVTNVLGDYDDGFPVTAPAGRFVPSPLGFLDLGGNAAEWVSDLYTVYPASAEPLVDPVGPAEGQYHVIRGSSWRHAAVSELRFAFRDFGSEGRLDVGFRIARFADPEGADQ
jgi:formylglycine-generating enzyme required for sulfatase activity